MGIPSLRERHGGKGIGSGFGLTALSLLPVALLLRVHESQGWKDRAFAPATVLTVIVLLSATDSVLNSMLTPMLLASTGAVGSIAGSRKLRTGNKPPFSSRGAKPDRFVYGRVARPRVVARNAS